MWPDSLRFLDVTCASLEANLAYDLDLLAAVESDPAAATLRIWELPRYAVIVGRSNDVSREVHQAVCKADDVPILRRQSGGGTVLLGPGCLCYTLALPIPAEFPQLGLSGVTRAVMERLAAGLSDDQSVIAVQGISDLVVSDRKISGNAQRWRKRALLHHGTLLHGFELAKIEKYLSHPTREPDYRRARPHCEFVANCRLPRPEIVRRLQEAWQAYG